METRITAVLDPGGQNIRITLNQRDWVGKTAKVTVVHRIKTQRNNGIDKSENWAEFTLTLTTVQDLRCATPVPGFSYEGKLVEISWFLAITVDDGILFDSKLEIPLSLPALPRDNADADAPRMVDPVDHYSLMANFKALAPSDRFKAMAMSVVCGALMLINMAIGWHDQWVPESQVIFYDHSGTKDGKRTSESPLIKSASGSAAVGGGAFVYLMVLLRRYMTFQLKIKPLPARNARLRPADLIHGVARVPLEGAEVRVIAANVERGQVRVKRDKKTETQSVSQVVRAICLYRQALPRVPPNVPIESYLSGEVDFAPLYRALYPPTLINATHGIDIVWEIQLLHPLYVDQEVLGSVGVLNSEDFIG